jgi:hypothetical protein
MPVATGVNWIAMSPRWMSGSGPASNGAVTAVKKSTARANDVCAGVQRTIPAAQVQRRIFASYFPGP